LQIWDFGIVLAEVDGDDSKYFTRVGLYWEGNRGYEVSHEKRKEPSAAFIKKLKRSMVMFPGDERATRIASKKEGVMAITDEGFWDGVWMYEDVEVVIR
jgi:hypothetical protein